MAAEIATATQLADVNPTLDMPLRIKAPGNVPERVRRIGRDDEIRRSSYLPFAYKNMKESLGRALESDDCLAALRRIFAQYHSGAPPLSSDSDATTNTSIKDFTILASSSKRVGKKDVEANAYLCLGIMYDNQNKLKQAIDNYKLYLTISEELGDLNGQALACNCIGANYMYMSRSSHQGFLHTIVSDDPNPMKSIDLALSFHEKHMRIADIGGQFVALTNLGLCYGVKRDILQSAKCHQDALRAAIKMQSIYGQSIAVGNLGMLAMIKSDLATARTCFEQHLNLVQALQDREAEVHGWKTLADLSTLEGNEDAIDNLNEARRVAAREGHTSELRRIHCLLGRTAGFKNFNEYAQGIIAENIEPF